MAHKRMVLALIALGAGLRAWQLTEAITFDEAHAYLRFSTLPLSRIITDYPHPLNSVLHTVLVKLSTSLFGVGVVQLRLPAFVAGLAVLPLVYVFARALFNRYIALMTLALCAANGPLVQYGSLATGYSLTWLCTLGGFILAWRLARTHTIGSVVMLASVLALGMFTMPVMVYPAATVLLWCFIYIAVRYDKSARQRWRKLLLAAMLTLVFSFLLYAPVIFTHGMAQLFHHPSMGDNEWDTFGIRQNAATIDLWIWISSTSGMWVSLLGVVAQLYSVYVSTKFRALVSAMALACIPLVFVHRLVGPPQQWAWILFLLHLGSAIALFYLLKFIQARLWPAFSKRLRTSIASLALFTFFGAAAVMHLPAISVRYDGARLAAGYLSRAVGPNDRVLAEHPWEAPIEFYLLANGTDPLVVERVPRAPCTLHILVSPSDGQTPESVLLHNKQPGHRASSTMKVKDWGRIELHIAKLQD